MAYNFSRNPLRSLYSRIGKEILIRLKDGTEYTGELKEYDNFMNVIITNVTEFRTDSDSEPQKFDEVFIRGNNVLFILPQGKPETEA